MEKMTQDKRDALLTKYLDNMEADSRINLTYASKNIEEYPLHASGWIERLVKATAQLKTITEIRKVAEDSLYADLESGVDLWLGRIKRKAFYEPYAGEHSGAMNRAIENVSWQVTLLIASDLDSMIESFQRAG